MIEGMTFALCIVGLIGFVGFFAAVIYLMSLSMKG